jgi:hypothetical protein
MTHSLTVVRSDVGFIIETDSGRTHARDATEIALAAIHIFGTQIGQQLDNSAQCPFCRDKKQRDHGYNWRAKETA